MKKDLHPEYFADAKVKCACGATYTIGSTKKEIHVEICAACHPFYTGQEKVLDTAGRVERFQAKRKQAAEAPKTDKKAKKEKEAKRRDKAATE